MPPMLPWLIVENEPDSLSLLMELSLVTKLMNACTSDPVARVPMNESIRMITTTKPFTSPMTRAAPMPASRASSTGQLSAATKWAAVTPDRDITYANDRSKTRADSGTIRASAASAVIALLSSTCLIVAPCGNVWGAQIEKTMQMAMST